MKTYRFDSSKLQHGLLMELGRLEETPIFDFGSEVHCTDFFEIMIFFRINGHIQLDDRNIKLENGQFLFISPYQRRRWFVKNEGIRGLFLIFEQDFLSDFFSDKLFVYRLQYFFNRSVENTIRPKKRLFAFEGDIFEEIFKELDEKQKDSPHVLRSILYYILIKLNREFCRVHHLESDTQLSTHAFLFKEALEQNIREKKQVNDYASLLGISRISLNTEVKRQFGKTCKEMIDERTFFEIKDELLFSNKTIAEIAYELNFPEPHHMIRFFKRISGQTPLEFKRTYQNGYS